MNFTGQLTPRISSSANAGSLPRERQPSPLDFEEVRSLCGSDCCINETLRLLGAAVTLQYFFSCGAV
jgi:hypothetical protein